MKNHFYMSYFGNKRMEVETIFNYLDFTNITTVVEPFCGSCAMSYYISQQYSNIHYVLNDNNKYLIGMYKIIIDDEQVLKFETEFNKVDKSFKNNKEAYNKFVKQETLMAWFIKSKIYCIRPGLFPSDRKYKETIKLSEFSIYDFSETNVSHSLV